MLIDFCSLPILERCFVLLLLITPLFLHNNSHSMYSHSMVQYRKNLSKNLHCKVPYLQTSQIVSNPREAHTPTLRPCQAVFLDSHKTRGLKERKKEKKHKINIKINYGSC